MIEIEKIKCEVCEKKMEWTPCSEKLPEEYETCIVTAVYKEDKEPFVTMTVYYSDNTFWNERVIAWMPLPEAYKGE